MTNVSADWTRVESKIGIGEKKSVGLKRLLGSVAVL
jgi:hypothetical protein